MSRGSIFVVAAILSDRALPLIWQRGEFAGTGWTGAVDWLTALSTYTPLLPVLVVALWANYRTLPALSLRAALLAGVALGATTAILFIPYDGLNQWRLAVLGCDCGFALAVGLLAGVIVLPRALKLVESRPRA